MRVWIYNIDGRVNSTDTLDENRRDQVIRPLRIVGAPGIRGRNPKKVSVIRGQ